MKILAVEFSSEQRSIAVVEKRDDEILERGFAEEIGGRTACAFELTEKVLRQAKMEREEIDCIAVGLGPGSYTGIRAAIALAQGWQLARDIKLLGINSVDCMAARLQFDATRGEVNLIVDAQRNEFYLTRYELSANGFQEIESLKIVPRVEIESRITSGERVFGPGAKEIFPAAETLFADAKTLGKLACERTDFVGGEKLEPIYLRETNFVKAPPLRVIP
jgi:tRNA threonylcarbamoyl adenosine modification protein YeaZ